MNHLLFQLNNSYFWKGFFFWMGSEENPFKKDVEDYVSTEPRDSIKQDLTNIRTSYKQNFKRLKEQGYIEV